MATGNVELTVNEETLKNLISIVECRVISKLDEHSRSRFNVETITELEQLQMAIGDCVLNSVISEVITSFLDSKEATIKEEKC